MSKKNLDRQTHTSSAFSNLWNIYNFSLFHFSSSFLLVLFSFNNTNRQLSTWTHTQAHSTYTNRRNGNTEISKWSSPSVIALSTVGWDFPFAVSMGAPALPPPLIRALVYSDDYQSRFAYLFNAPFWNLLSGRLMIGIECFCDSITKHKRTGWQSLLPCICQSLNTLSVSRWWWWWSAERSVM